MTILLLACLIAPQEPSVEKKVAALIEKLSSEDLAEREKAQGEIQALGPAIKPRLEAALKEAPASVAAHLRAILDTFAWDEVFAASLSPVVRFTLEKKRRTPEELFALIREKTGWIVQAAAMNVREPFELEWRDASALQILDDVCRALKRGRVQAPILAGSPYPGRRGGERTENTSIVINGSRDPAPCVAYWNQFRAEVDDVTISETRDYSKSQESAAIRLVLSAQPGTSVLRAGMWRVDEIVDDRGRSLKAEAKGNPFSREPEAEVGDARDAVWFAADDHYFDAGGIQIQVPESDAARISVLKTRIRVTLAGREVVESRKVSDLKDGGEIRIGEAVVTITKAEKRGQQFVVNYRVDGKYRGQVRFEPLDEWGRVLATQGSGFSGNPASAQADWHVRGGGEVSGIRLRAMVGHRTFEIPFELKDIPLPKRD